MTRKDQLYFGFFIPGMPFDGNTPLNASLGGSETAAWAIARELAKRGHRIKVFSNLPGPSSVIDGVHYCPLAGWTQFSGSIPHDVAVVQRHPESFANRTMAKVNLLWCHDLALGRNGNNFRSAMWNIDRVMVVSDFMKKQYQDTYELPEDELTVARNGIYLEDLPTQTYERDMYRLAWGARFERGFDVMLEQILPKLLEHDKRFQVVLFGYNNPVDQLKPYYAKLKAMSAPFGDRVIHAGYLPKKDLYTAYHQCGVYAYPTPSLMMPDFAEVSCISAMEAQMCGLPIVTTNRGALSETIAPGAGVLVDGDPTNPNYADAFVRAVVQYVELPEKAEAARVAGRERAQQQQWSEQAAVWEEVVEDVIRKNNDSPLRLAYHFYRRTDTFAAMKVVKDFAETGDGRSTKEADGIIRLGEKMADEYKWVFDKKAFAEHYRKGGIETDERLTNNPVNPQVFQQTDEKRFHEIEAILARHPEYERILDYGCGHGWGTIYYHNKVGRNWIGVDVDPGAVKWARGYAAAHANYPSNLSFVCGTEEKLEKLGLFDAAICSEVLEHCVDPIGVIEKIEKAVKPGGLVLITVPYGPSEWGTPNWERFRNHLWEFDMRDIYDLFDDKETLNIDAGAIYPNEHIGEMIGFWLITYKADHKPLGLIDWKRKLTRQRPRHSVAAGLIGGPNSHITLRWCLESLRHVMDDIIIADTGMTDEGKRIAKEYGARLIECEGPLVKGFEYPRNVALEACDTDWYLWIDTDERLYAGDNLTKYLRDSMWCGVAIRQHHFAVDHPFQPDMPVRCFRTGDIYTDLQGVWGHHRMQIGRAHV